MIPTQLIISRILKTILHNLSIFEKYFLCFTNFGLREKKEEEMEDGGAGCLYKETALMIIYIL